MEAGSCRFSRATATVSAMTFTQASVRGRFVFGISYTLVGFVAGLLIVMISGCGRIGGLGGASGAQVGLDRFVGETAPSAERSAASVPPRVRTITAEEARAGLGDVVVIEGPPSAADDERSVRLSSPAVDPIEVTPPGERVVAPQRGPADGVLLDQMVGQINGEPIYAAAFLDELDARFRGEARNMSRSEWLAFADGEIERTLVNRVRDRLLLDEFYNRLTAEQREGLLFFLANIQQDLIARSGGSAARADERLQETVGRGLAEQVRRQADRQFIIEIFRDEVARGLNVSWRDVERYYYENPERFTTPGRADLRIIRVRTDDAPRRDAVVAALASGEPFADVAAEHSSFRRAQAGLWPVELGSAAYGDVEIIAISTLNDAAAALDVGETAGPIQAVDSVWWIKLESVEPAASVSLYEAQNQISALIYEERLKRAELDYFRRLLDAASLDNIDTMRRRILLFAAERYLGLGADAVVQIRGPGVRSGEDP